MLTGPTERSANGIVFAVGDGFVDLEIVVVPGASRSRVIGAHWTALRIAVSAPPERGKANDAVCALLAEFFGVREANVAIASGHSGRTKRVRITGLSAAAALAALNQAGA